METIGLRVIKVCGVRALKILYYYILKTVKRIEITSKAILWVTITLFMISIMFLQNQ